MAAPLRRFASKTVVVTGATGAIGRSIALRFAAEGAGVVVSDLSPRLDDTLRAIEAAGGRAVAVRADVTKRADVERVYDEAEKAFGPVDISVQNAGVITIAKYDELTEEEWDQVMRVNTTGVWLCCQAAAQRMVPRKWGRLINTASGQARAGFIYTPHYAASKMGVVGITQSLAKELAKTGVTVNATCPGIIGSEMWQYNDEKWGPLLQGDDYKPGTLMQDWVDKQIPMGRAGTGEDVAGLYAFLASDDARYITGQTINVDGGLIMS